MSASLVGPVVKYYLYRAATTAGFTAPIWYYYVLSHDISYAQLGVIDAVWWVGLVVFEIPTGYLGDRIGRRNALLASSVMVTVALVAMTVADSFLGFAAVFGFWAVAATFRSGTADAWLYDALTERLSADEFTRVRGRGDAVMYAVSGATGVLGGYLAELSMDYAYFASAAAMTLSVPVLLSLPETGPDGDERFTVRDALPVVREQFTDPPLRSFVPYFGLFVGVYWGVNFFIQPFSVETLGLSLSEVGWLFGGFTAVGAVLSYEADAIRDAVGVRGWFTVAPPLLGALFVLVAAVPAVAVPVFFLLRGSRGVTMPLANQYINDRVGSVGRATVLSAAGMVCNLVTVPFELGAGRLADALGVTRTVGLFGAVLVVGSLAFLLAARPFSTPDAHEPAAD